MPALIGLEFCGMAVWRDPARCPACNRTINREAAVPACTQPPARRFPLSLTSDGFFVATGAFRRLATESAFTGLSFLPLENRHHVMQVHRRVAYADLDSIDYRPSGWCDTCASYAKALVAPKPRTLSRNEAPIGPLELVKSQHRFGTEMLPGPVGWTTLHADLIAGDGAAAILRHANFRGLRLTEVQIEA